MTTEHINNGADTVGTLVRSDNGELMAFFGTLKGIGGYWVKSTIKHIPVTVYEEIKFENSIHRLIYNAHTITGIRWFDNNGVNTPYLESVVNRG